MNFYYLDLLVLFLYFIIVIGLGIKAHKTQTKTEFFLGNKNLPWYLLLFSIVATETSTLTFLSVPGIGYSSDLSFLQIAIGYILGRVFVSFVMLPNYFKSGYISIYEWISETFGHKVGRYASVSFIITRVLGDGVRLFATSIPVVIFIQYFFHIQMNEFWLYLFTLLGIAFVTILYTVYGGFRAVVWTDSLQFFIYVFGGIFAFGYIIFLLNQKGISEFDILQIILENNKSQFFRGFQGNFLTSPYFFLNAILGGMLLSVGSHGVDQMFVQRALACKTETQAKLALIGSGFVIFLQFALFLGIGILLFVFYGNKTILPDKVFSKFIVENIPSPFLGFLLASILASAMSTLSSSINSLSLTTVQDWNWNSSAKKISFLWGMILFFSSMIPLLLSSSLSEGLVELGLRIASYTMGPLIGLFLLGRLSFVPKIYGSGLGLSIFFGISLTMFVSYKFELALAYIIAFGILSFYALLFLNMLLVSHKHG